MTDLHADVAGHTHLHFTVRVPGTAGVVRFDVEPARFLFPLVRSWPTASASGEAYLARRDGDQVLFLTTLQRQADAAARLRHPLAAETLPAAIALRAAGTGTTPGVDYRGVPVFAAWQPVSTTSWVVVAKMDREEALAGARGTALWIAGIAALALSLVAYTLLLLLRQQRLAQELARDAQAGRLALFLEEVITFQEADAANLGALAPRVTEAAANAAGAARANLWLFNEGETQLRCIDHFDAVGGEHSSGAVLEEAQFRTEFEALKSADYVDAEDALSDPRTAGYAEGYLKPFGITSMLDAVIKVSGRHRGLLCIEHVGRRHRWTREEITCASRLADQVGFAILNRERRETQDALNRSHALLENTERLGGIGGWDWDIAHDTLTWSKETYRIMDRPQGSVVKVQDFMATVSADDRPGVEAAIDASLAGENPYDIQFSILRTDGSQRICRVRGEVIRDAQGRSTRMTGTLHDITDLKLAEERLAHLAQHDALTDLPNRLLLTDRVNMALARAQRGGKPLALLFVDLDRFKNVNDVLGHEQGDHVLAAAAARLKSCVRASDTVSRLGGDEFLVLLADIELAQDAARVSQKLIEAVSRPYMLGGAEFVLTASIGIACHPEDGADFETLMRNADAAMYAAKQGGRNRYQFYSAKMNARARDRLRLETDLRHAIARGELFLAYQPQVDLESGTVVGAEALIRWQHPTLGLVPPADFIGIAEDSGQIVAIGAWVLATACRQQAAWLAEGLMAGIIAVNVSAHQFRQADFAETVTATLASSGLSAGHLELEVTESALMHGVEDTLRKLGQLDRLGVKLSIDDFGTGYSSLSYLKQFPVYRLKIDQSFTRGLPDDTESAAIAQAVISMGHSLGLNVLAEGVETPAQEERLRAMWCDAAQGYLYSKPVPADAYAAFLRARAVTSGA
jgi:diguanylate cyclase (GGDEF)-like protein